MINRQQGQGAALQHAAFPADQRREDAAAQADPRPAADAGPRGGAAADRAGAGQADDHQPRLALGRRGQLGRGDHPRQLGQHGRRSTRTGRGSRRPRSRREQILDELRDGDQVALFLTGGARFPEQGQARPHPGKGPPDARHVRGELRAGRPGRQGPAGPASCWPMPTPPTSRSTSSATCRRSPGRARRAETEPAPDADVESAEEQTEDARPSP